MERKDVWIEVPLRGVLSYWVDAYEDSDDAKIVQRDSFVGVTKNVVLFRLVIEKAEK